VGPVPDPLLLRKSNSAGNRTLESVTRKSDHWSTFLLNALELILFSQGFITFELTFSGIMLNYFMMFEM
jgi:hypothetical protein